MHVGMEKAVAQGVAQKGLNEICGQHIKIMTCGLDCLDVGQLDAIDPIHGNAIATGQFPVDGGNAETGIIFGVFAQFGKSGRLKAQIHFDLGGLGQHVCHCHRSQPPGSGNVFLLQAGNGIESIKILAEALTDRRDG